MNRWGGGILIWGLCGGGAGGYGFCMWHHRANSPAVKVSRVIGFVCETILVPLLCLGLHHFLSESRRAWIKRKKGLFHISPHVPPPSSHAPLFLLLFQPKHVVQGLLYWWRSAWQSRLIKAIAPARAPIDKDWSRCTSLWCVSSAEPPSPGSLARLSSPRLSHEKFIQDLQKYLL